MSIEAMPPQWHPAADWGIDPHPSKKDGGLSFMEKGDGIPGANGVSAMGLVLWARAVEIQSNIGLFVSARLLAKQARANSLLVRPSWHGHRRHVPISGPRVPISGLPSTVRWPSLVFPSVCLALINKPGLEGEGYIVRTNRGRVGSPWIRKLHGDRVPDGRSRHQLPHDRQKEEMQKRNLLRCLTF
jgi:hypothetical protein